MLEKIIFKRDVDVGFGSKLVIFCLVIFLWQLSVNLAALQSWSSHGFSWWQHYHAVRLVRLLTLCPAAGWFIATSRRRRQRCRAAPVVFSARRGLASSFCEIFPDGTCLRHVNTLPHFLCMLRAPSMENWPTELNWLPPLGHLTREEGSIDDHYWGKNDVFFYHQCEAKLHTHADGLNQSCCSSFSSVFNAFELHHVFDWLADWAA